MVTTKGDFNGFVIKIKLIAGISDIPRQVTIIVVIIIELFEDIK